MRLQLKALILAVILGLGLTATALAATGNIPGNMPDMFAGGSHFAGTETGLSGNDHHDGTDGWYGQYLGYAGNHYGQDAGNRYGDGFTDCAICGQYGPAHGQDVAGAAGNMDAMGTMAIPGGHQGENHGQAVQDGASYMGGQQYMGGNGYAPQQSTPQSTAPAPSPDTTGNGYGGYGPGAGMGPAGNGGSYSSVSSNGPAGGGTAGGMSGGMSGHMR